jgi:hypothetical protein
MQCNHWYNTPYTMRNFIYLGCKISYENEKNIQHKLAKLSQTLWILNNNFKPNLVQKF